MYFLYLKYQNLELILKDDRALSFKKV